MHGGAEHLSPPRGDIGFMHAGQWFATSENIKKSAERTGEECHQDKAPFHDGRLRRRADVDRDKSNGQRRQDEPQQNDAIKHGRPRCNEISGGRIAPGRRSSTAIQRASCDFFLVSSLGRPVGGLSCPLMWGR